jgi:hypothetical protein
VEAILTWCLEAEAQFNQRCWTRVAQTSVASAKRIARAAKLKLSSRKGDRLNQAACARAGQRTLDLDAQSGALSAVTRLI